MIHCDLHSPAVCSVTVSPPLLLRLVTFGLARSREGICVRHADGWQWERGRSFEPCSAKVRRAIARAELVRLRAERERLEQLRRASGLRSVK